MPRSVYTVLYVDPATGFLKRLEFDTHRDREDKIRELKAAGVRELTRGSFETG